MFRPERLLAARTLLDVTQVQLAEASNVKQAMVSMVETYRRDFSESLAARFAHALALPIEFFTITPRSIPHDTVHFRKRATSRARDSARAHALFVEGFRISEDLLDDSGYPSPNLPLISEDTDHIASEQIEALALEARAALGIDLDSPITNVLRTLERSGVTVAPLSFTDAALDGHYGMSYSAGKGKAAMVAFIPSSGDRNRFTLAHELGHLLLHSHRRAADPEAEANAFAGAFLMPLSRASELVPADATLNTLARVKAGWGISIAALVQRGKRMGTISTDRATTLHKQISSRGWRTHEPVEVTPETPRLLYKLMQARFGERPFSSVDIEHQLALPILTLRSLAPSPPVSSREDRPVALLERRR